MNENVMDFHFFNAKINIFEIMNRVYVLAEWFALKINWKSFFDDIVLKFLMLVLKKNPKQNK